MKPKPITFQRATAENMPPVGTEILYLRSNIHRSAARFAVTGYVTTDGRIKGEYDIVEWSKVAWFAPAIVEWESEGEDE